MSFLTAYHRLTKNIFANPEDAAMSKVKVRTDESVERVRRAHLNDMENIVPFLFIGLIYVGTSPAVSSAVLLPSVCRLPHGAHSGVRHCGHAATIPSAGLLRRHVRQSDDDCFHPLHLFLRHVKSLQLIVFPNTCEYIIDTVLMRETAGRFIARLYAERCQ